MAHTSLDPLPTGLVSLQAEVNVETPRASNRHLQIPVYSAVNLGFVEQGGTLRCVPPIGALMGQGKASVKQQKRQKKGCWVQFGKGRL